MYPVIYGRVGRRSKICRKILISGFTCHKFSFAVVHIVQCRQLGCVQWRNSILTSMCITIYNIWRRHPSTYYRNVHKDLHWHKFMPSNIEYIGVAIEDPYCWAPATAQVTMWIYLTEARELFTFRICKTSQHQQQHTPLSVQWRHILFRRTRSGVAL